MEPHATAEMLALLRTSLGLEAVPEQAPLVSRYQNNVTGFVRQIVGVVLPRSTAEVVEVVLAANRFQVPLYPISSGKNWGMGSKLPVEDGAIVVDLRRMNRLGPLDAAHGYLGIESGVTQQQVHDYLRNNGLPFVFNVVGSSTETSLIGNALERGVGWFGSRVESVSLREVVLGTGKILNLGLSHYPGSRAAMLYRYGVGPDLQGLFFQSNLGIVTGGTLELIPAPEQFGILLCGITDPADLPRLMDGLRDLQLQGVLKTGVHTANRARTEISMMPLLFKYMTQAEVGPPDVVEREARALFRRFFRNAWTSFAGLLGTASENQSTLREVRARLGRFASVRVVDDRVVSRLERVFGSLRGLRPVRKQLVLFQALAPILQLARGIPNNAALASVTWPVTGPANLECLDPDLSSSGMHCCLPVVPLDGACVREATEITTKAFHRHGFIPYITYNVVTRGALESVIGLAFNRADPEETARSLLCLEECLSALAAAGYYPYRLGIGSMRAFVRPDDPFWATVQELKKVLDPNNILSRGRYCPG